MKSGRTKSKFVQNQIPKVRISDKKKQVTTFRLKNALVKLSEENVSSKSVIKINLFSKNNLVSHNLVTVTPTLH